MKKIPLVLTFLILCLPLSSWAGEEGGFRKDLKERLAFIQSREGLTDDQKQAVLQHVETQYRENVAFRDQRHQENLNFIDELAAMTDLSKDQRKAEIQKYREARKQETQEHRQTQREENQAFRQSIRK